MSREPPLDASVLPHQLDEFATILLVRMVQPAAAVDDVVLLQDAQTGAVGRGVGEDEDLPPLVGGMSAEEFNEPGDLLIVDNDLVAGVGGIAEDGTA